MRWLPVATALGLVACTAPEQPAGNAAAVDVKAANTTTAAPADFAPPAPKPLETASVDPPKTSAPGAMLPAADRQYRYIGRWAANPGLCESGAWRFRTRKLTTAGESSCDLPEVAVTPRGYRLTGTCSQEGTDTDQTLELRFDEAARTMTVKGRTLGPATLIYCGD